MNFPKTCKAKIKDAHINYERKKNGSSLKYSKNRDKLQFKRLTSAIINTNTFQKSYKKKYNSHYLFQS